MLPLNLSTCYFLLITVNKSATPVSVHSLEFVVAPLFWCAFVQYHTGLNLPDHIGCSRGRTGQDQSDLSEFFSLFGGCVWRRFCDFAL